MRTSRSVLRSEDVELPPRIRASLRHDPHAASFRSASPECEGVTVLAGIPPPSGTRLHERSCEPACSVLAHQALSCSSRDEYPLHVLMPDLIGADLLKRALGQHRPAWQGEFRVWRRAPEVRGSECLVDDPDMSRSDDLAARPDALERIGERHDAAAIACVSSEDRARSPRRRRRE